MRRLPSSQSPTRPVCHATGRRQHATGSLSLPHATQPRGARNARPAASSASIDIRAAAHQHQAKVFDAQMERGNKILPSSHPCHVALSAAVNRAAEELGLKGSPISLTIFESYPRIDLDEATSLDLEPYLPQAFINPVTRRIYLNTQLLEALDHKPELIHPVLYHELAHLIFAGSTKQRIASWVNNPFGDRLQSYEIEYHCDRVATLLSSLFGEPPQGMGNALRKLMEYEDLVIGRSDYRDEERAGILSDLRDVPLLSTHPSTLRRCRANEVLTNKLPRSAASPPPALPAPQPADLLLPRSFPEDLEPLIVQKDLKLMAPGALPRQREEILGHYATAFAPGLSEPDEDLAPPLAIRDLLDGNPSSEQIADWHAASALYFGFHEEEFLQEWLDEISGCSLEESAALLRGMDPGRYLPEHRLPATDELMQEPLYLFTTGAIVNHYIALRLAESASPAAIFSELVGMARETELSFGGSPIFLTSELSSLAHALATSPDESEHQLLVSLVDSLPSLRLGLTDGAALAENPSPSSYSPSPVRAAIDRLSQAPAGPRRESTLLRELQHHALARALEQKASDLLAPVLIRRIPGGSVAVMETSPFSGEAPFILISFGDQPLSADDQALIRQRLTQLVERENRKVVARFSLNPADTPPVDHERMEKLLQEAVSLSEALLEHPAPTEAVTRRFFQEQLPALWSQHDLNDTDQLLDGGRSLLWSRNAIYLPLSDMLSDAIKCRGEDAARREFVGQGRESYESSRCLHLEALSLPHVLAQLLWNDLHAASYASLPEGLEKAQELLKLRPFKSAARDLMLCEALSLGKLSYLDDIRHLQPRIMREESTDVLTLVRDAFMNEGLAQTAEARLFQLHGAAESALMAHPDIARTLLRALKPQPEELQRLAAQEPRLRAILGSFSAASRERDRHLRPFVDGANSIALKEALGALLADPSASQVRGDVEFESRVKLDSVFQLVRLYTPYDKAQALLYFMGEERFSSPAKAWFNGSQADNISDYCNPSRLITSKSPVSTPDCLIRAQKRFGIAISTVEGLQSGLLNERTITDFFAEALSGEKGIYSDERARDAFFKAAGAAIVQNAFGASRLPKTKLAELSAFVATAFAACPERRLPMVLLKVWEASRGSSSDVPTLTASILASMGPAFVKFGQKLATLNVPPEYKRAFRSLSSENRECDSTLFYHTIRSIYGSHAFDNSCSGRKIAEGSMAATFECRVPGAAAASVVKLIHPFIHDEIETDCAFVATLVRHINTARPFGQLALPPNTADVIRQQLRGQTDTDREVANTALLRSVVSSGRGGVLFRVPEVTHALTRPGAIVTPLLPGYELDSPEIAKHGLDSGAIRRSVGLEVLRMMLVEEAYQSDVNLGNFGVLYDPATGRPALQRGMPTVVWYDAGAVEPISKADQKLLLQAIRAAFLEPARVPQLLATMLKAGPGTAGRAEQACRAFQERLAASPAALTLEGVRDTVNSFFDLVSAQGLEIEERWLVLANTLSMAAPLLEGVSSEEIMPVVIDALKRHKMLSITDTIAHSVSKWLGL